MFTKFLPYLFGTGLAKEVVDRYYDDSYTSEENDDLAKYLNVKVEIGGKVY